MAGSSTRSSCWRPASSSSSTTPATPGYFGPRGMGRMRRGGRAETDASSGHRASGSIALRSAGPGRLRVEADPPGGLRYSRALGRRPRLVLLAARSDKGPQSPECFAKVPHRIIRRNGNIAPSSRNRFTRLPRPSLRDFPACNCGS